MKGAGVDHPDFADPLIRSYVRMPHQQVVVFLLIQHASNEFGIIPVGDREPLPIEFQLSQRWKNLNAKPS